jgi:type II restriction/modification system DNA methylase subunit YeeA
MAPATAPTPPDVRFSAAGRRGLRPVRNAYLRSVRRACYAPRDAVCRSMTAAEFKRKWSRYQGKETSAYQGHFDDLCRLLGQPTPAEADPSGSDFFCYQKRVVKDAELLNFEESPDASEPTERGFADVWKKGCFAWEYKGKKKNLDEAYKQLLRYRESLLNPPLLVVCDFDRYIVKTNFNGTVQDVYEFTNDQIDRPENVRTLRALFTDPEYLKPQRTTAAVTEALAQKIAEVARSLQKRASAELTDAKSRAEMNLAQRKNLRIARFLNRIVFCMFAEDTRLLPADLFTEILKAAIDDPTHFAKTLEDLFNVMATGGSFGQHKIRHFNGHLFDDSTVFELNEAELRILGEAAEADWQFIQPSIMGTLFERALEPEQRSQLGAHYTSEADIKTLVEPVLMQPFRREWAQIKGELGSAYVKGKGNAAQRERLAKFQKQLSSVTVLDPACGSGNFLYVSLQLLLGLEKEVITFASQLGFKFMLQVTVPQLKAIEINPYAFELAQVSVQIGYLQWRRDNGFDNDRSPVLQVLDGFLNEDALLVPHFRNKAKSLKEARAGEHAADDALKFYTEREWPKCDVIIGNPPFKGDKLMRGEFGNDYVEELWKIYDDRLPRQSNFCCYWFEKARALIANAKCKHAGLLATQNIRGGASRHVLDEVKKSGDIFFAISDREWILDGAMVHISMVGFDDGTEIHRVLDGKEVSEIHANLSASVSDVTKAVRLDANSCVGFIGSCKGGAFDIEQGEAATLLMTDVNPHGLPNSDLIRPVVNSDDLTTKRVQRWIIDTSDLTLESASRYEAPFKIVVERVKPHRDKNRDKWLRENWWRPQRMRSEMRKATYSLERFIVTPTTSKHRVFAWLAQPTLPDHKLVVIARSDDAFFGVLHSRIHELWSKAVGTQNRERESGLNYNVQTSFELFPFPLPMARRAADIAAAAKELNELRERWLNPPEWTKTRTLEFPGSVTGPWSRYVEKPNKNGIGTVRYPRLEPRDAECAAKLKNRTLTKLYNERPTWLDIAHKKLDAAVAAAYDFPVDLTDEQILERLLALNLARAAEEAKAKTVKKPKAQRMKQAEELL